MPNNKSQIHQELILLLTCLLLSACQPVAEATQQLTASESQLADQSASERFAPVDVLAAASLPASDSQAGIVYTKWAYYELEAYLGDNQPPGPLTKTTELWAQMDAPFANRFITTDDLGQVHYDGGYDSEHIWVYNRDDSTTHAIFRPAWADEIPAQALDAALFANPFPDLLDEARQSPDQLTDLGSEDSPLWGTQHLIGFAWDGATAQTNAYTGYSHTLVFQVDADTNWLTGWQDLIHTPDGDIIARSHSLLAWDTSFADNAAASVFHFTAPDGVDLVSELPDMPEAVTSTGETRLPDPSAAIDVYRLIGGHEEKDLGFTPLLLTDFNGNTVELTSVEAKYNFYMLQYEFNGQPVIRIFQTPGMSYKWGNTPEIIELDWATVELAPSDPLGSPGWVAMVKPRYAAGETGPNVNLLVDVPDRELVLALIESLRPAE